MRLIEIVGGGEQNLARASGVVSRWQPDRRLQQAQALCPDVVLEWAVLRNARASTGGEIQGGGASPHKHIEHRRAGLAAVA